MGPFNVVRNIFGYYYRLFCYDSDMVITFREILIIPVLMLTLVMGYFVWSRKSRDLVNISFGLACLNIIGWGVGILIFRLYQDLDVVLFWGRFIHFLAFLIPVFLITMVISYPLGRIVYPKIIVPVLIMLSIFSLFLSFHPEFINGLTFAIDGTRGLDYHYLFYIYAGALVILFNLLFVYTYFKFIKSNGIYRNQYRYMLIGILISSVLGMVMNLILVGLGNFRYNWLGPVSPVIMLLFMAYAIVAHRLFDIRVIIKRTVVFAGLSAFVLGTYIVIIFTAATLAGTGGQAALASKQLIPNLLAALAIAVGFEPLRRWMTVRTDKWLFKGEYTPEEVLRSLSDTLANVIDLVEALDGMMQLVVKSMRLHRAVAFIVQPGENEGEYELKRAVQVNMASKASQLQLAPKDALLQYFIQSRVNKAPLTPVVTEELIRAFDEGSIKGERAQLAADLISRLEQFGAAVALPLFLTRQQPVPSAPGSPTRYRDVESLVGVLLLGEKKSGDAFTDQDLKLLEILSNQTAAAVEKARFFEEDQLKSEFVSIASHELLTPTAAMEGYLSMILEEDMGKVDDKARGYLEKVFAESKRLASLVKDLLNVSRIERGKIVVNLQPVELAPLIETTIENLQIKAKERGLKLTFDAPKSLPKVMADPEKLTEVVMNIAGNGLKYTAEGTVTVSAEVKGNQVLIHTKDSGIGMKPADIQHLFTKFFRASNSDQTGQTGTGLGLYISKHVIELMGGTMGVTSEIGKGSTFTFSLPIAKLSR